LSLNYWSPDFAQTSSGWFIIEELSAAKEVTLLNNKLADVKADSFTKCRLFIGLNWCPENSDLTQYLNFST